jgi:8-oxo-dGTP pyrophosphatase MutT (NUDIX family)
VTAEPQTPVARRRCARVLLVDEEDRLLLFYSKDFVAPDVEYYVTVGGGAEDGESLAEAAAREVLEETGLVLDPAELGPVVARTAGVWSDTPDSLAYNEESYFFHRVRHFEPVRDGLEEVERREFTEARWLTAEQLEDADHLVFPARVSALLRALTVGPVPLAPVELEWGAWCWDADRGWTAIERPGILER